VEVLTTASLLACLHPLVLQNLGEVFSAAYHIRGWQYWYAFADERLSTSL
jgi:hypothetical protein